MFCEEEVELIISDNGSTDKTLKIVFDLGLGRLVFCEKKGIGRNRNNGAHYARGDTLVFTDSDNTVSLDFFSEISELTKNRRYVGGGVRNVKFERLSLGIILFFLLCYLRCYFSGITLGAFWIKKKIFNRIHGFNNRQDILDDVDFAVRLRDYAKRKKLETKSLHQAILYWSTRKFDKLGDWYWIKNLWSWLKALYTMKCDKKITDTWYEFP